MILAEEDYSEWPKYQDYKVRSIGYEAADEVDGRYTLPFLTRTGRHFYFVVTRQHVKPGAVPGLAEIRWHLGPRPEFWLGNLDPQRNLSDFKPAWLALRAIARITPNRPGPKPGTGVKYPTSDAWYAALNEKVRPKNNRWLARRETIAYWLGVSVTILNQNKRKWGPKKLDDIRQGRF